MTNFEKYYNTIKEYAEKNRFFAIINNIPAKCDGVTSCKVCYFHNDEGYHCRDTIYYIKWLLEENRTLTKEEHAFCEMVNTGYLVRDENDALWYSIKKPYREYNHWQKCIFFMMPSVVPQFTFISWEDEPYKIEDLLTYPVEIEEGQLHE